MVPDEVIGPPVAVKIVDGDAMATDVTEPVPTGEVHERDPDPLEVRI